MFLKEGSASGGFGWVITILDTFKKRIFSHFQPQLPDFAATFQQTTRKTPLKSCFKKFEISKNAEFWAKFKYEEKNCKQLLRKVISKIWGKNKAFYAVTHTRLFNVSYFFSGIL